VEDGEEEEDSLSRRHRRGSLRDPLKLAKSRTSRREEALLTSLPTSGWSLLSIRPVPKQANEFGARTATS